jgi:hypothetical protein
MARSYLRALKDSSSGGVALVDAKESVGGGQAREKDTTQN